MSGLLTLLTLINNAISAYKVYKARRKREKRDEFKRKAEENPIDTFDDMFNPGMHHNPRKSIDTTTSGVPDGKTKVDDGQIP